MKKPVVIIPGYYGSKLTNHQTDELVWLAEDSIWYPKRTMQQLRLDIGPWDRLKVSGILDEFQPLTLITRHVYKPLIKFVTKKLERKVHEFAYDWRKSLDEAADLLHEKIKRWLSNDSASKLDIVTHSFGGLVARAYLQKYGAEAENAVDWLITIASPHKGMLKTFRALAKGMSIGPTFKPALIKETSRTLPSAYELVPQAADDGMFSWDGEKQSAFARDGWCETPEMVRHLSAAKQVVETLLPSTIPVKTCAIYGTRVEDTDSQAAGGREEKIEFVENESGDGTVPQVSARADGLNSPKGLFKYPVPYGRHNYLFRGDVVKGLLTDVLLRDAPPDVHFTARFSSDVYFRPRQKNCLVVELRDNLGSALPNADVRLEQTHPKRQTIQVPQTADGDYVSKMQMPGPPPNSILRGEIIASAPGLSKPLRQKVVLYPAA